MGEARYDAVADSYAADFDAVDDPASLTLLGLLASPAGLRVLDVACRHGRITRELARRGAHAVGLDISAALNGPRSPVFCTAAEQQFEQQHRRTN